MSINKTLSSNRNPQSYKYSGYFKPVQPGLAMTPSQIKSLTDRGIAVTSQNSSIEPVTNSDEDSMPEVFRRDMDLNTSWELENTSRTRILKGVASDRKKYGINDPNKLES